MKRILLSLVAAIALLGQVAAQTFSPLPVSTVWLPQGRLTSISVTTSSAATLLPTAGQTAWLCNTGANDAFLTFGTSNLITATVAAGAWLKAGSCGTYARNPTTSTLYTYVAAIGSGGSTTIYVETGLGTPPSQLAASGSGTSVTQGTVPWVSSITQWAGGTLGAMAAYGTSPGAVLVPGVNAFVTGGTVTANIGTLNGAATAANQTTGNASLASIDTKMSALTTALGAAPMQMTGGVVGITGSVAVTGTFWQATQPMSLASSQVASGAFVSGSIGSGAIVDLGAIADAAATAGGTGTINAKLRLMTTQLATINTTLGLPMQATGGTVTANAGTNLNTSLLALESGGNLATAATNTGTTNTNLGAPGATVCATDTGSCSVNALLQRIASRVSTVNTTLNSPFQAGGSIGNTSFAATQATAASLNATVVGTGTFAVQAASTQSGTWNIATVTTLTGITNALPAGTNLLGKVGLDQTTPGTTNAVSLAQIGSTTTATGNGVVGTGVQRVAIASDNTAFSVNATLGAETTKVIGTVNISASQSVGLAAGSAIIGAVIPTPSSSSANAFTITNATSAALEATRAAKASAGNVYGAYVTAVAGGSAGFLVGYNATSCPADGAVTAALVLDVCVIDTTNKGCSISRPGPPRNYSVGICYYITTGASPFANKLTGTNTGFISVDYN